jgi:hypothetical protein
MQGGIHSYLENHSKDGGFWVGKNYTFDKRYSCRLIIDLGMVQKKVLLLVNAYLAILLGINTGVISAVLHVECHY